MSGKDRLCSPLEQDAWILDPRACNIPDAGTMHESWDQHGIFSDRQGKKPQIRHEEDVNG